MRKADDRLVIPRISCQLKAVHDDMNGGTYSWKAEAQTTSRPGPTVPCQRTFLFAIEASSTAIFCHSTFLTSAWGPRERAPSCRPRARPGTPTGFRAGQSSLTRATPSERKNQANRAPLLRRPAIEDSSPHFRGLGRAKSIGTGHRQSGGRQTAHRRAGQRASASSSPRCSPQNPAATARAPANAGPSRTRRSPHRPAAAPAVNAADPPSET